MLVCLKNVHRVRKRLADGSVRFHDYHRPTRTRLPDPEDPSFIEVLGRLNKGAVIRPAQERTFSALVAFYQCSDLFSDLADKTKRDYRRHLSVIEGLLGDVPVRSFERQHLGDLRERFGDRPRTANSVVQVMRLLLSFAHDRGWVDQDVALRPRLRKTGDGHLTWEEEQVTTFQAHRSLGMRERTLFEVLVWTGQRGGDVASMMRDQIRADHVKVHQEKTGALIDLALAEPLAEALSLWRVAGAALFPGKDVDEPLKVDAFRHIMASAHNAAGHPWVPTHGLRYTVAVRLHEVGVDWGTIADVTGHATVQMVRKYLGKRRPTRLGFARVVVATVNRSENCKPSGSGGAGDSIQELDISEEIGG
jgi:integrase